LSAARKTSHWVSRDGTLHLVFNRRQTASSCVKLLEGEAELFGQSHWYLDVSLDRGLPAKDSLEIGPGTSA
jgi:hypothetical protein